LKSVGRSIFLEIGVDRDDAHFLVQSVPSSRPAQIVRTVKRITAREGFAQAPEVRRKLWGGKFWGQGYFVNTVGQHGSEKVIAKYVKRQGSDYRQLHKGQWSWDSECLAACCDGWLTQNNRHLTASAVARGPHTPRQYRTFHFPFPVPLPTFDP
jgi:hypothetical protein